MTEKFYVTTPIYYVNDVPHIGHAYTTIAADVLARYHRRLGKEVFFLTGTDEHGAKIAEAARERGKSPKELCDEIVEYFKAAWRDLSVSYDHFIRTTDPMHEEAVKDFLTRLHDAGEIYKAKYEGRYCVGCEKFVTDEDLVDGLCPLHNKEPILHSEENYFFRLSHYREVLVKAITDEKDPNHFAIGPETRRNEVLGKLRLGLGDISISRATLTWGIPLPFDPSQTTYVWVDALLNYVSAIGYKDDQKRFRYWWPADIHLMAKDILWFHTVIWPAMLIAAGLKPPKKVFAHGFFTINGQKISKSLGNILLPSQLIQRLGSDATRYLMLSGFPFGIDGDISEAALAERYNADLGNDLGNLLHRTLGMINRYYQGTVPEPAPSTSTTDEELKSLAGQMPVLIHQAFQRLAFEEALETIWQVIDRANKYVEENAPWSLQRTNSPRLATVLYNLAEVLRLIAQALWPVMPNAAQEILEQLGTSLEQREDWWETMKWGKIKVGSRVAGQPRPLFPKLELDGHPSQAQPGEPSGQRARRS